MKLANPQTTSVVSCVQIVDVSDFFLLQIHEYAIIILELLSWYSRIIKLLYKLSHLILTKRLRKMQAGFPLPFPPTNYSFCHWFIILTQRPVFSAVNSMPIGYPVLQQTAMTAIGQPHFDAAGCALTSCHVVHGIPAPARFQPISINSGKEYVHFLWFKRGTNQATWNCFYL